MPSLTAFSEALGRGVLVFDGAMGTEIYRHHVFTNRSFDELCLADPQLIEEIHRQYCEAGADVLTTNTFGANRVALAKLRPGREGRPDQPSGGGHRPPRGRRGRPAGARGRLDRPAAADAGHPTCDRRADRRAGRRACGRAGPTWSSSRRSPPAPPWSSVPPPCAACRRCPTCCRSCLVDQAESAAGEPVEAMLAPLPADGPQPVAWGMNCGTGPDGLLRGGRAGGAGHDACRWSSSPTPASPRKSITGGSTSARPSTSPSMPSGS